MATRRLVLLRHAKSSWVDADLPDHDRPLDKRGRRDAALVGEQLRSVRLRPEMVLCSSAVRTRETLELLRLEGEFETTIEDDLYGAGPDELLGRLRRTPLQVTAVLVVGHNPGLEELTNLLIGDRVDAPLRFPTGAFADLGVRIETWRELDRGVAQLDAFVAPRELRPVAKDRKDAR
jgi:phosphohistidine phosphatase